MFCFPHPTEEWTGLFVIFLNSASSAAALVFYLPGVCTTHTDTERKQSPEYFKIFEKKTQYLMNTLLQVEGMQGLRVERVTGSVNPPGEL